jgi:hypothetical protein
VVVILQFLYHKLSLNLWSFFELLADTLICFLIVFAIFPTADVKCNTSYSYNILFADLFFSTVRIVFSFLSF